VARLDAALVAAGAEGARISWEAAVALMTQALCVAGQFDLAFELLFGASADALGPIPPRRLIRNYVTHLVDAGQRGWLGWVLGWAAGCAEPRVGACIGQEVVWAISLGSGHCCCYGALEAPGGRWLAKPGAEPRPTTVAERMRIEGLKLRILDDGGAVPLGWQVTCHDSACRRVGADDAPSAGRPERRQRGRDRQKAVARAKAAAGPPEAHGPGA